MANYNFKVVGIKDDIIGIESQQAYALQYSELVYFETGAIGMILRANAKQANVALVSGESKSIGVGTKCQPSGQLFSINIHQDHWGKIIDVSGQTLVADQQISDKPLAKKLVFEPASPMYDRVALGEPLVSGTIAIDGILPIGLGQKQLIVGDAATGKSALAITMMLAQAHSDVDNIYVAIGKKREEVLEIAKTLADHNVLNKTIIVSAASDHHAASKYLAPYVGASIAKYWQEQGRNVLVIFDDLSNHADAHRQLSLLNGSAPGREAFPGDIFYTHSRLLERCGRFNAQAGGGSITMIPIVQTEEGDISAYIPTNIISITDGQIYTSKAIFNEGRRPAIEIGVSVSRLGSQVQIETMKKATSGLKNIVANYENLQKRASFGNAQLSKSDLSIKTKGVIFQAIVDQREYQVSIPQVSALLFFLLKENYLDGFATNQSFNTIKSQINLIKEVLNNFLTNDILGIKLANLLKTKSLDDQSISAYLTTMILPLIKGYLLEQYRWLVNDAAFQTTFKTIRDDHRVLIAFQAQNQLKGIMYNGISTN